ncbi:hypothetical protein CONLIGDRAFT_694083 [Coniochaeta ligniaria NRRL 30616]|uniref:Cytochrome oxidase subunit II copper A binding domain-containing protein n=1 Tax=Coniochaeta ligniaria NRRL 30616 TaxID=1408157 RepID=A0A1J7I6Z0_9PEZI|nr:hypothetical protein CONLIGDRAFT_694083 [Coniochaeta ligniaria NRRL 30616]
MDLFYVSAIAGQIYVMPGMETKMHTVIHMAGRPPAAMTGVSANFNVAGVSHMIFQYHGLDHKGFDGWVTDVKLQRAALNRDVHLRLKSPATWSGRAPTMESAENCEKMQYDNRCVRKRLRYRIHLPLTRAGRRTPITTTVAGR